jgi:hypothetical protein
MQSAQDSLTFGIGEYFHGQALGQTPILALTFLGALFIVCAFLVLCKLRS